MLDYCTTLGGRLSNEWSKKIGKRQKFFCFLSFCLFFADLYPLNAQFRLFHFFRPFAGDIFPPRQRHEIAAARKNFSCAPPQRCNVPNASEHDRVGAGHARKQTPCSLLFPALPFRIRCLRPGHRAATSFAALRRQPRRKNSSLDPIFLNALLVSPCTKLPISFLVQYFASAKKEEVDCSGAAINGTRLSEKQPSGRCSR